MPDEEDSAEADDEGADIGEADTGETDSVEAGEVDPADVPIDGTVILLAGAKASVSLDRLPKLLAAVQADLSTRRDDYDREYECVVDDPDRAVYLVDDGHWSAVGDRLGFNRRETDAVCRTHEEQLLRLGRTLDRREEFETALEIREAVVIGRP